MNDSLYRLVYISRNRIEGGTEAVAREIGRILNVSRMQNAEADITGALMYKDGCFAQVLEGPHDTLQDTFERVQCDERHDKVRLLGLEAVSERGFGDWAMAYVGQDEASRAAFAALVEDDAGRTGGALDSSTLPPERIYALLKAHLADAELHALPRVA